MSLPEQAGKVVTSTVDAFKAQPGLLFLTLVNIAFLVFVYFVGTLVLDAYTEQQKQIHERYRQAIHTVDRCISTALDRLADSYPNRAHIPSTDQMRGETINP